MSIKSMNVEVKKWIECDINEWLLDHKLYTDQVPESAVRRLVDTITERIRKSVPEKAGHRTWSDERMYTNGVDAWNACRDEMLRRIG